MSQHIATTPTKTSALGIAGAVFAVVLWALGAMIVLQINLSGLEVALWRSLMSIPIYFAILRFTGRKITKEAFRTSMLAGAILGIEVAVFFSAIKSTTIVNATVIGALQPLLLLLFGAKRFGERRSLLLVGLAVVSVGGIALVTVGSSSSTIWTPLGDVLALCATILFAAYFITSKRARETVDALVFQTSVWISAAVVLVIPATIEGGGLELPVGIDWLWVLGMVAVPGTGHLLMNWAHGHTRLSIVAMINLSLAVFTTGLGVIFYKQGLGLWQVIGMAIVLGAMAVAIQYETASKPDVVPA